MSAAFAVAALLTLTSLDFPRGYCPDGGPDYSFVRLDIETRILGTVLPERLPDVYGTFPGVPQVLDVGYATLLQFTNRTAFGYRIRVESAEGYAGDLVEPGSEVVVFRWNRISDRCHWTAFHKDSLEAGSRQHFTALLRPDSLWIDNLPTFDLAPNNPVAELPGASGKGTSESLVEELRDFTSALPSEHDWKEDCRTATGGVQSWLDAHRHVSKRPPLSAAIHYMRANCERALERKAEDLERWDAYEDSYEISPALRQWLRDEGCQDLSEIDVQPEIALRGRYVPTTEGDTREQWAVICARDDYWRLLVVLPEPPAQVHELVRMPGIWDWMLSTGPAEYFLYMSAREFDEEEPWRVPRPRYDVALLEFEGYETVEKLAVFWTEDGWQHVVVLCCHWPE